jgi:hypothetical protein
VYIRGHGCADESANRRQDEPCDEALDIANKIASDPREASLHWEVHWIMLMIGCLPSKTVFILRLGGGVDTYTGMYRPLVFILCCNANR